LSSCGSDFREAAIGLQGRVWVAFFHWIRQTNESEEREVPVAFVLDFDAKHNILRVTLEGHVTDAILVEAYAAMARCAAARPACRGIADITGVTKFDVSNTTVRRLAETAPAIPTAQVRVFVAPTTFVYGMARMFQMLGEKTRPNLHIARTLNEAYSLLQVESPEFDPVS
jgi:hypothetical protein